MTSKGVLDLIDAVAAARWAIDTPFLLRIVGNLVFSDPPYVEAVKSAIRAHRLDGIVEFLGTTDDRELQRLYHRAHIFALPSYHEGFCKPVIEALRAGCVPVTYSGYSLATIAGGLSRTVAPGDVGGFGRALGRAIEGVVVALDDAERPCLDLERGLLSARQFDDHAGRHIAKFSPETFALQMIGALEDELARPSRAAGPRVA